jgi:lipid A 3-O-deacylase
MLVDAALILGAAMAASPTFSLQTDVQAPSLQDELRLEQEMLLAEIEQDLTSELRIAPAMFQGDSASNSASSTFGAEGTQRWALLGGWGIDVKHDSNNEVAFGVKWEYFIADGFAFAPELKLWGFFQDGGDAFGGSLDLLFEWHFLRYDTWSIFGDAGVGLLGTTRNVPINGSEFNFTPQAGIGVTWDVGNDNRWVLGVRWHHISNAGLYSDNPGRDSIYLYTGLNMPF